MNQDHAVKTISALLKHNNAWLAPMAGVTDRAFRLLCKEQNAGLTCTEMVSAKGLHYGGDRSRQLLALDDSEIPAAIQIFGSDPAIMAEQAAMLCDCFQEKLALIDINMGCPATKITRNGEGSALMQRPWLAADILKAVANASSLPVTAKFRKGWDDNKVNAVDFALRLQDAGAAAVTIHGRTRMQFYSGCADWDSIAAVKDALDIPVIGNGDIFCADDAKKMLEYTGVDGILIARGAQGNPWIFAQIRALLDQNISIPPPSPQQRADMALRHARLLISFKGDRAIVEMRKHVASYLSGLPGSAAFRAKLNRIDSYESLCALLNDSFDDLLELLQ